MCFEAMILITLHFKVLFISQVSQDLKWHNMIDSIIPY